LITDTAWGLVAGGAAGWVRGRSSVRSVQRWVTGCVFIGLGLVTAFAHTERR